MSILLSIAVTFYVWLSLKENKPKLGTTKDKEAKVHYVIAILAFLLILATLFSSIIAAAISLVVMYFRKEIVKFILTNVWHD